MSENAKSVCPICKNGEIKIKEKMVCCSNYAVEKQGKEYVEVGCHFHIFYKQEFFQEGFQLRPAEIKAMIDEGKELVNRAGDKLILDTTADHCVRIERKERVYESL